MRLISWTLRSGSEQQGHQAPVHSDQMVLVMARQEAVPCERWPKMLKGELENNSREPNDLVGKLA